MSAKEVEDRTGDVANWRAATDAKIQEDLAWYVRRYSGHWKYHPLEEPEFGPCIHCGDRLRVDRLDLIREHLLERHRAAPRLTVHEVAVLQLLATGLSVPSIARERNVAKSTILSQLKELYRKLGVRGGAVQVKAVIRGIQLGLIEIPPIGEE